MVTIIRGRNTTINEAKATGYKKVKPPD